MYIQNIGPSFRVLGCDIALAGWSHIMSSDTKLRSYILYIRPVSILYILHIINLYCIYYIRKLNIKLGAYNSYIYNSAYTIVYNFCDYILTLHRSVKNIDKWNGWSASLFSTWCAGSSSTPYLKYIDILFHSCAN